MRSHDHTQQDSPSEERPHPPPKSSLIKQQPNQDAAHDLSDPINRIIQRPPLNIEQHGVIVAKLPGVKVIAGEEHGKEQDDERVGSERGAERFEFFFP